MFCERLGTMLIFFFHFYSIPPVVVAENYLAAGVSRRKNTTHLRARSFLLSLKITTSNIEPTDSCHICIFESFLFRSSIFSFFFSFFDLRTRNFHVHLPVCIIIFILANFLEPGVTEVGRKTRQRCVYKFRVPSRSGIRHRVISLGPNLLRIRVVKWYFRIFTGTDDYVAHLVGLTLRTKESSARRQSTL